MFALVLINYFSIFNAEVLKLKKFYTFYFLFIKNNKTQLKKLGFNKIKK